MQLVATIETLMSRQIIIDKTKQMQFVPEARTFLLRLGDYWEVVPLSEEGEVESLYIKPDIEALMNFLEHRAAQINKRKTWKIIDSPTNN